MKLSVCHTRERFPFSASCRWRDQRSQLEVEGDAPLPSRQPLRRPGREHRCMKKNLLRLPNRFAGFTPWRERLPHTLSLSTREGLPQSLHQAAHRKEALPALLPESARSAQLHRAPGRFGTLLICSSSASGPSKPIALRQTERRPRWDEHLIVAASRVQR